MSTVTKVFGVGLLVFIVIIVLLATNTGFYS